MRSFIASLALALPLLPFLLPATACASGDVQPDEAAFSHPAPKELYNIITVVDGDTIHIQYNGRKEKLRLLSVDTEEKMDVSPTKPATVFGQECALWAAEYFAKRAEEGKPARIGLVFPDGKERRGTYGRLLCHVVAEDGTDFNLLLVQLGKSPYFNKYGNSKICHEEFVQAQNKAREAGLGIWSKETNQPDKEGRAAATRPYPELLAWWDARAAAIDNFREKNAKDPKKWIAAEDAEALKAAEKSHKEVVVFCTLNRIFEESNGSQSILMRSADRKNELRVMISSDRLEAHAKAIDLENLRSEFAQNYVFIRGKIRRGGRGFELHSSDPKSWTMAGPEPVMPK